MSFIIGVLATVTSIFGLFILFLILLPNLLEDGHEVTVYSLWKFKLTITRSKENKLEEISFKIDRKDKN